MSDDERSDSSSEGEDVTTTGLIATRAKRATAGNLYATLRANLDDEELQKELLAEDEDDQGEYEASDKEDDDAAMESSSDEEDAGPPKEGVQEDLEGEKALKRAERAEAKKKRKMEEVKMRIPAFARAKKRVKLADDVKTDDGSAPKPKKKSERADWRPRAEDAPIRQSSRAAAVANREVVHANLKESLVRSEKQKKVMANHAAREQFKKRMEWTQEERLAKTARIEKETAREFGRWEREEAERQRIRDEQLAAKRNRGLDGPVIRYWSGSVLWEGEKIKVKRLHGSTNVDEIKDGPTKTADAVSMNGDEMDNAPANFTAGKLMETAPTSIRSGSGPGTPGLTAPKNIAPAATQAPSQPGLQQQTQQHLPSQCQAQTHWLDGIEQYASQQPEPIPAAPLAQAAPMPLKPNPYVPSAPSIHGLPVQHSPPPLVSPYPPLAQAQGTLQQPLPNVSTYHAWPPGFQGPNTHYTQLPYGTAPPPPLPKEQARRSLIILEQFEHLEAPTSKRGTSKTSKDAATDPTPVASTLLPESYPSFSPDQSRYLVNKKYKKEFPQAPEKAKCALTAWPAKFRDPKAGLPYADIQQYKMIQRLLMGGCQWSSFLGAWVGPAYSVGVGRPARGVPDGFGVPIEEAVAGQDSAGDTRIEDVG